MKNEKIKPRRSRRKRLLDTQLPIQIAPVIIDSLGTYMQFMGYFFGRDPIE
jgi:hypothetical protein